jgi:hypothetical protein
MAIDTATKRAAVAHVKRLGKGVTPGDTGFSWRAAVAWNYGGNDLTPAAAGGEGDVLRLGECPVQPPTLGHMFG